MGELLSRSQWLPAEDIFPDPMSQSVAESWRSGAAKALERQLSALVAAGPVQS
jgi:hypothetical protein